jgi:putative exosortase-associated protein (TIGR04073 family)
METANKIWLGGLILILVLNVSTQAYSDDGIPRQIGHKLARGMANTLTGWAEVPKQMYLKTSEGPLPMGVVEGVVEAIGMTFARTTAGLYEIATFAIPLPWHYQPLFEPEYVWEQEPASGPPNEAGGAGSERGGSKALSDGQRVDPVY